MEAVVALFIFSMIMLAVTYIFGSATGAYRNAKVLQRNLENAQHAMNQVGKTVRTSKVFTTSGSTIGVYDYSKGGDAGCLRYRFTGGKLLRQGGTATDPNTDQVTCSYSGTEEEMVSNGVDGEFFVVQSEKGGGVTSPVVGRVTMSARICESATCSGAIFEGETIIQTTVSLRNF